MFVYNLSVIPLSVKQPNLTVDLSRLFRLRHIFSAIFNRVADAAGIVLQNTLCSPGLGAGASTSRKPSASRKGKLMVFRVCGNKGIACTVAFVYTQALLAPLLQICSAGFSVVYRKINASDCFAMWRKHIWVVI